MRMTFTPLPTAPGQQGAMDFVHDVLADAHRFLISNDVLSFQRLGKVLCTIDYL